MQFWLICILSFVAGYFLMGLFFQSKEKHNIRIAVYDKETGNKRIVTVEKGFDDEIDNLIREIKRQQNGGMK